MIPNGFAVKRADREGYILQGTIRPRLPKVRPVPCRIVCSRRSQGQFKVYLKSGLKSLPWLPSRGKRGNWLQVDLGREVRTPIEALIRTEALVNHVGLETDRRPEQGPPAEEEPSAGEPAQGVIKLKWDGLLLLEIADYLDYRRETLEQICYVAGLKEDSTHIPTRYYEIEAERGPAHAHPDPVSKAEALQHMRRHGLRFLGAYHSQPEGYPRPSPTDIETARRWQRHFPAFTGCVFFGSGKLQFYGGTRPVRAEVEHPRIREVVPGEVFQIEGHGSG